MKSSDDTAGMAIGDLAARFGLATHVLRHWESMDLLRPVRDGAGRRRYGADDVTRVATILLCKEAGLGLDTIRTLAATVDRESRHRILRREAGDLRARIAAAQTSLALIEGGLRCGHEDFTRCPNYRRLIAERVGPRVPDVAGRPGNPSATSGL
jgi:MerR family transcriptional regulator, copper efflux regulator